METSSQQTKPPSLIVHCIRKARKCHGFDIQSTNDFLLDEFCELFWDVHVFHKPPDLVRWSDDGECYEISWFSLYYIVIDPNNGVEFRKFPGPMVSEFPSLHKFKQFCIQNPEEFVIKQP